MHALLHLPSCRGGSPCAHARLRRLSRTDLRRCGRRVGGPLAAGGDADGRRKAFEAHKGERHHFCRLVWQLATSMWHHPGPFATHSAAPYRLAHTPTPYARSHRFVRHACFGPIFQFLVNVMISVFIHKTRYKFELQPARIPQSVPGASDNEPKLPTFLVDRNVTI